MRNVQKDIDEIYEKKHLSYEKEIMALKKRCEFLEEYWAKRMHWFYDLSKKYDEILSFEICWKTVEEWKEDDKKVVKEIYPKKKKWS